MTFDKKLNNHLTSNKKFLTWKVIDNVQLLKSNFLFGIQIKNLGLITRRSTKKKCEWWFTEWLPIKNNITHKSETYCMKEIGRSLLKNTKKRVRATRTLTSKSISDQKNSENQGPEGEAFKQLNFLLWFVSKFTWNYEPFNYIF